MWRLVSCLLVRQLRSGIAPRNFNYVLPWARDRVDPSHPSHSLITHTHHLCVSRVNSCMADTNTAPRKSYVQQHDQSDMPPPPHPSKEYQP